MSGLSLTNTRDVQSNNIYVNYDGIIINILDLFSQKNEITNNTNDFNEQLNLKRNIADSYTKTN